MQVFRLGSSVLDVERSCLLGVRAFLSLLSEYENSYSSFLGFVSPDCRRKLLTAAHGLAVTATQDGHQQVRSDGKWHWWKPSLPHVCTVSAREHDGGSDTL